ncbi:hypothetical protein PG985_003801 [Apiospora marii]|uniref:uncharacterized protein n=1 Tax=Apiospora marii TaxID=335849 RepID=UPI00312F5D03
MTATFILSFRRRGRSYRLATAGALLPRLAPGNNGLLAVIEAHKALAVIDELRLAACRVGRVIPREHGDRIDDDGVLYLDGERSGDAIPADDIPPPNIRKARDVVEALVFRNLTISDLFGVFACRPHPHRGDISTGDLDRLLGRATETELLIGQLIVSADSPGQKEQIRRAMLPFRSSVYATKACLENLVRAHDVGKARVALQDITATTGLRWFGFSLGVLPQVIKLFGSSGIPRVQACGAMYLFSWIVFEVLVVSAKVCRLDQSDDLWLAPEQQEYAQKRDDDAEASLSTNRTVAELPPGSVVWNTAALSAKQRTVLYRTAWQDRSIDTEFVKFQMLSAFGGAGLLFHISTLTYLMNGTGPLDNSDAAGSLGRYLARTASLVIIPVWINNMDLVKDFPIGFSLIAPFLIMSFLAVCKMSIHVFFARINGRDDRLAAAKCILVFTGASLFFRLHIGGMRVRKSMKHKLSTALRVVVTCFPVFYYCLVRYEEQGTKLLSWAEWLG